NFQTAPRPEFAKQLLEDYPLMVQGGSVDKEVNAVTKSLRSGEGMTYGPLEREDAYDLANWVESEHKAGKFDIGSNRTRNFVVFDPKNLEIRTWNGRLLEPSTLANPFGEPMPEGFDPFRR